MAIRDRLELTDLFEALNKLDWKIEDKKKGSGNT
jgi:hypothetical protein